MPTEEGREKPEGHRRALGGAGVGRGGGWLGHPGGSPGHRLRRRLGQSRFSLGAAVKQDRLPDRCRHKQTQKIRPWLSERTAGETRIAHQRPLSRHHRSSGRTHGAVTAHQRGPGGDGHLRNEVQGPSRCRRSWRGARRAGAPRGGGAGARWEAGPCAAPRGAARAVTRTQQGPASLPDPATANGP